MLAREGFAELLRDPLGTGRGSDLDVEDAERKTSKLPKTTGLGSRSCSRGAVSLVRDDRKGTAKPHPRGTPA